jgi:hypothetical protein
MAKIVNYKLLLFTVATFVIISSPNLLGSASAWTVSNNYYSHQHSTVLTNPSTICGDHKCAPGEIPQQPPVVTPVKEIQ